MYCIGSTTSGLQTQTFLCICGRIHQNKPTLLITTYPNLTNDFPGMNGRVVNGLVLVSTWGLKGGGVSRSREAMMADPNTRVPPPTIKDQGIHPPPAVIRPATKHKENLHIYWHRASSCCFRRVSSLVPPPQCPPPRDVSSRIQFNVR